MQDDSRKLTTTKKQLESYIYSVHNFTNHSLSSSQQGGFFAALRFFIAITIIIVMVMFGLYVAKLDRTIVSRFEGKHWNIPAKVYSRPLKLHKGAHVSPRKLEQWLKLLNYQQVKQHITSGSYSKNKSTFHIQTRGFEFNKNDIEPEQRITVTFANNKINKISSSNSQVKMVRLEPVNIGGIYPDNNEDRTIIEIDQVPKTLIKALIATEDRSFYKHHGVSFRGIARAVINNFSGKSMQGGSTLTQQLVKNFYLTSERTLKRKANEAIMAVLLETHYDKDTILQTYLNEINLGQNGNRSINGFSLAAEFYFNRPLDELTIAQQALLVGLAKGPSFYNPRRNPEKALARRNTVLNNMLVTKLLTQDEYDTAVKQPLTVVKQSAVGNSLFPDFLDVVKRELASFYELEDLKNEGLIVISTLDPVVQTAADEAINKKILQLRKSNRHSKKLEGALVSTDPKTGELLAIVGGFGRFTGFNRATQAKRQVGSLLKPIIYLNALESGKYNLASTVDDSPITVKMENGGTWSPKNYDKKTHENVSISKALASSYNQAAVRVGMEFGVDEFIEKLEDMGINDEIEEYPSTLLGANQLSPMQMTKIYQVFASGGLEKPIHSILTVVDEQGNLLQGSVPKSNRSIDEKDNYLINHALQTVVQEGTAKKALAIGKNIKLAGKTGTTNNFKDAWFAGYSGNYVSVVWVGRDDNKSIGLSGGSGALPIWVDFMKRLDQQPVSLTQPKGIEWQWLENNDGRLSSKDCPNAVNVPVLSKYLPKETAACGSQEDNVEPQLKPFVPKETTTKDVTTQQQKTAEQLAIDKQRKAEGLPPLPQVTENQNKNEAGNVTSTSTATNNKQNTTKDDVASQKTTDNTKNAITEPINNSVEAAITHTNNQQETKQTVTKQPLPANTRVDTTSTTTTTEQQITQADNESERKAEKIAMPVKFDRATADAILNEEKNSIQNPSKQNAVNEDEVKIKEATTSANKATTTDITSEQISNNTLPSHKEPQADKQQSNQNDEIAQIIEDKT